MNSMFSNCINLKEIILFLYDTSNVEDMNRMFFGCKKLKEIDFFYLILLMLKI